MAGGGIPVEGLQQGERRVGAASGGKIARGRRVLAGYGAQAGISDDSQEDDRSQVAGVDLRVGAVERRDATLLLDAGNSGAAGVRADRNYSDLHHG